MFKNESYPLTNKAPKKPYLKSNTQRPWHLQGHTLATCNNTYFADCSNVSLKINNFYRISEGGGGYWYILDQKYIKTRKEYCEPPFF